MCCRAREAPTNIDLILRSVASFDIRPHGEERARSARVSNQRADAQDEGARLEGWAIGFTISNSKEPTLRIPVQVDAGPPFVLFFRPHNEGGGAPIRRPDILTSPHVASDYSKSFTFSRCALLTRPLTSSQHIVRKTSSRSHL